MNFQDHANDLFETWDRRRHLAPALRLSDVPQMNDAEFESSLEELRVLRDSDPQWRDIAR